MVLGLFDETSASTDKKSSTHPGLVGPNFKDLGHLIRCRNIWKHG